MVGFPPDGDPGDRLIAADQTPLVGRLAIDSSTFAQ
jgi:hypothetical protein